MDAQSEAPALTAYLEARLPAYIRDLQQLCAIECPTASRDGVNEAGAWVRRWVEIRGWQVRTWADSDVGDSLVITLPGGTPDGPFFLLAAHLDTVYPVGIAAERPLREEGDKLIGPGSADNKSGLLSALYAMAALEDLELLAPFGSITLVCGGDEETDMRSSVSLLQELAPAYDVALVLECGRENGDIVSARKSGGHFTLELTGHEAHAGVEPHKGSHAILALAQQILALQALNGIRPGATLNVGVVEGGTLSNVVPGRASAEIDVRAIELDDMAALQAAIERIALHSWIPGVTGNLSGGWKTTPMPRTPAIAALAALAVECADELGFPLTDAATGGISYANALAGMGLPVLDGLGPVGGLDHSPQEYILISSIVPRTALLALLMLRRASGGI